jgi:hypothetical protein
MRIVIAFAIAFLGLTAAGRAATISYADAVTQLAGACGADIKKLCKGLNLGNNRIRDCLTQNAAQVSPTCNSTLAVVLSSIQVRQQAQADAARLCRVDADRWCHGVVPGEAHILNCLIQTSRVDSRKCNDAITDAGWR